MVKGLVSIVIPSRNEQFLRKTIDDLLAKATQDIEIIAVLDGYWPPAEEIINNNRVRYLHFSNARGMRNAINSGVAISNGEYILKIDAHCMVAQGFDVVLKADCEDNWVVIPTRKRLDPFTWTLRDVDKPDMNYMFMTYPNDPGAWGGAGLHGREWREKNRDPVLAEKMIDDCMDFQGSFWFMKRSHFDNMELMDEDNYGSFPQEAQEIGLKTWLSGGRVIRNKNTWYAHWHKGKENGRGYHLDKQVLNKGTAYTNRWLNEKMFSKQIYDIKWLVKKFWPVPGWPEDYGK